jgi:uncharacterized membrane protein
MSSAVALAIAAAILGGLTAGVFLAFSTFVVQGLDRNPVPVAVAAMQGINVTAPHPLFMLPLFGGPLVGVAAAVADPRWWIVAGAVAGLVPALMTVAFHIPRNLALDAFDPDGPDTPAAWTRYRREWVAGNHVRTLGGLVGAVLMSVGAAV